MRLVIHQILRLISKRTHIISVIIAIIDIKGPFNVMKDILIISLPKVQEGF